ncbi:MAG: DNA mismatch repair protein MutT, partial [Albidovulum sp.]
MENLFTHEGQTGHEILFIAEIVFPHGAFDGQDIIEFTEDDGTSCTARWYAPEQLDDGGISLFPSGLKSLLRTL